MSWGLGFYLRLAARALQARNPRLARAYLKRALARANQLRDAKAKGHILAALSHVQWVQS